MPCPRLCVDMLGLAASACPPKAAGMAPGAEGEAMLRRILASLGFVVAVGCSQPASPSNPTPDVNGRIQVAEGVWYSLDDAEERNRQSPDTFKIPTRDARDNLEAGHIVKLLFAINVDGDETVERMWVIVERRDGGGYLGRLDNQPASTDKMPPGMAVRFQARHVIDIHPKRATQ